MTVEAATTITGANGFVLTSPSDNDPTKEGGSQLRLIKSVLATTFPNVTGPITATQTQLNNITGALTGGLFTVPTSAVAHQGGIVDLQGYSTDGDVLLENVGGNFAVVIGGVTAMAVSPTGVIDAGAMTAQSVMQKGNPLVPAGLIAMWAGNSTNIPGGWTLCNGLNGTPNLSGMFVIGAGTTSAAGSQGGAASSTVSTSTTGAHAHGGVTGLAGGVQPTGITDQQGTHSHGGSSAPHSLSVSELPPHQHSVPGGLPSNQYGGGTDSGVAEGFGNNIASEYYFNPLTGSTGSGTAHNHAITSDGLHQHNLLIGAIPSHSHAVNVDGNHAHTVTVPTLPPFYSLAFIMKL